MIDLPCRDARSGLRVREGAAAGAQEAEKRDAADGKSNESATTV